LDFAYIRTTNERAENRQRRAAVTAAALERLREAAPAGVEVVAIDDALDLGTVDFLVPASSEARVLEALPELTRVEVVQVLSAGTDRIEERMPSQATLCNARGARDGPVAEWVVAALLGTTSRTLECARLDTWTDREVLDLERWTVLVVGMGSIGRHVARLLEPFGTRVVGVASRARDDLHGVDELPALLPDADAVVVLTPLRDSTRGLIGAVELAAMRDGALLVNAGRGPAVDTEALLAEVSDPPRLRAVLDVTDPEPLPDGHPLWSAPGVLSITPHIAGDSLLGHRRALDLAARQLTRWAAGDPLENVVRSPTA
jgi:phosphoglycerate dehydrogenase-like enzyme